MSVSDGVQWVVKRDWLCAHEEHGISAYLCFHKSGIPSSVCVRVCVRAYTHNIICLHNHTPMCRAIWKWRPPAHQSWPSKPCVSCPTCNTTSWQTCLKWVSTFVFSCAHGSALAAACSHRLTSSSSEKAEVSFVTQAIKPPCFRRLGGKASLLHSSLFLLLFFKS